MRLALTLVLVSLPSSAARLELWPGEGTQSPPGAGLTDKQLGLLNYFAYMLRGDKVHATGAEAAADTGSYRWPSPPWTVLDRQAGLSAVRYPIAFAAYAVAELAAAQTPAFPGLAASLLRDAFARLVSPTSWAYWDKVGECGWPFSDLCRAHNLTMCELNPHHPLANHCPDPVKYQNVMYSAHLAQVGALYEAFSGDASLTTDGWAFDGPPNKRRGVGPVRYTMPTLLEALAAQTRQSPTGAFACEPTMVYLVCNQHVYAAARLYDALYPPTSGATLARAPYSSERLKWLHYLNSTAVRAQPKSVLGEGFFEILYQETLRDALPRKMPWVEIADVGGCAGNDGWAGIGLGFWLADDETSGGGELLGRVRGSLAGNEGWRSDQGTGGSYMHQRHFPYETQGYTTELATAWAPAALGGWSGLHRDRVGSAFAFMEGTYGTPIDTDEDGLDDGWYYQTDGHGDTHAKDQMWATGGLGLGMARSDEVVSGLYSGALMKRVLSRPHLVSVMPAAPAALVRRAVFDTSASHANGTLRLTLAVGGAKPLRGVALTIAAPAGWRRADGGAAGDLHGAAPLTFKMSVDLSATNDTAVEVAFVRVLA